MSRKIIRVFVSSTWADLGPERRAIQMVLAKLHETKFVGMEYFGSRPETTREASLKEVDQSDMYVAILGERYGSGITEAEYRRARERKIPCFIYVKDCKAIRPEGPRDGRPEKVAQLVRFKRELQELHTSKTFSSPEDLAVTFAADFHNWLRARQPPYLIELAKHLLGTLKRLLGMSKQGRPVTPHTDLRIEHCEAPPSSLQPPIDESFYCSVNRVRQMQDFHSALPPTLDATTNHPVVCVVYGHDAECGWELIDRLGRESIPAYLRAQKIVEVNSTPQVIPCAGAASLNGVRAMIWQGLDQKLHGAPGCSPKEVARSLRKRQNNKPTLLSCRIAETAWSEWGQELVGAFLEYWNRIRLEKARHLVCIFVSLEYGSRSQALQSYRPTPPRKWATKFDEFSSQLHALRANFPNVTLVSPLELRSVTKDECIEWARELSARRAISSTHVEALVETLYDKSEVKPMHHIATFLRKNHELLRPGLTSPK